jgi:glycosyltransferase involved in cell wall biosynthesis
MASGKPIVASDLPSIREILDGSNAFLVAPDDAVQLAEGITQALADDELSASRADKACDDAKKYSWLSRAKSITEYIG